jgi:hypothetical protein
MGKRGPTKGTGGRPRKNLSEKLSGGNPGKRPLKVLDIPELEGATMPKPHAFLFSDQRDGNHLQAAEIYKETWEWLKKIGCSSKVSAQLLERYAMCSARWIQTEELTSRLGFLSKHPTTGKPIPSPFINIGINYMNHAVRLWNEIFQIVKENCSADFGNPEPQDDLMERLLRARDRKAAGN